MTNADLLTHKHLATIVELQKLAMSMTLEEFIEFIKADYNYRDNYPYIDFDYHDLTATICINSKTFGKQIALDASEHTSVQSFFRGTKHYGLSCNAYVNFHI